VTDNEHLRVGNEFPTLQTKGGDRKSGEFQKLKSESEINRVRPH